MAIDPILSLVIRRVPTASLPDPPILHALGLEFSPKLRICAEGMNETRFQLSE